MILKLYLRQHLIDALHVATVEAAGCDFLLTTDDRLLNKFSSDIKAN